MVALKLAICNGVAMISPCPMAIEIIEKINAAFGLRLRAVDIFKYVSPYGLAEHIKEIKKTDP